VACTPTVGISGNPAPPANVPWGTTYITVSETTTTHNTGTLFLYSSASASGPWSLKGSYTLSGGSTYGQHTFNVANYVNGSYYWQGQGVCASPGGTGTSSAIGPYTTP